jgi:hypothetical protein
LFIPLCWLELVKKFLVVVGGDGILVFSLGFDLSEQ